MSTLNTQSLALYKTNFSIKVSITQLSGIWNYMNKVVVNQTTKTGNHPYSSHVPQLELERITSVNMEQF